MVLHAYFSHVKVQSQEIIPLNELSNWSPTGLWWVLVFLSLQSLLAGATGVSSLAPAVKAVDGAISELEVFVRGAATKAPGYMELAARDLAYSLARIYTGRYQDHRFYKALLWCYFSTLLIHLLQSGHREISSFWVHADVVRSLFLVEFPFNSLSVNRCSSHWPRLLERGLSIWHLCSSQVQKKKPTPQTNTDVSIMHRTCFCCFLIRWCENDLCPVATKQARGCFDSGTPPLDAALVFDRPTQDWKFRIESVTWSAINVPGFNSVKDLFAVSLLFVIF